MRVVKQRKQMCEKAMNIKRITAIVPTYQLIDLNSGQDILANHL